MIAQGNSVAESATDIAAASDTGGRSLTGSFGYFVALLPFLFIFNTELLLIDVGPLKAIFVTIVAIAALPLFAAATQGFWLVKSKIWETVTLLLIDLVLWVQRRRRVVPAAKAA